MPRLTRPAAASGRRFRASHPIRSAPATTHGTRPDHGPCGNTRSERCDRRNRSCRPANPDRECSARPSWKAGYRHPTPSFKLPRRGHFLAARSAKKRRSLPLPLRDIDLCQYRLQTFELLRVVIRPEMYEEETRFAVEHVVVDRATSIPWSRSTRSTGFTSLAIRTKSPVIAALPADGRLKISSVRQTHYRRDIHPAILDRFRAADTESGRRGGFLRRHGDGWNTQ